MQNFNLEILIVEDNLSYAIELEMIVSELEYQLLGIVNNADDALKMIYSKKPDLILMDIDIKGQMTGIDIAEKIKEEEIPILFLTSFDQEEFYQKALNTNLIGYLIKPVNKFTLRSAIEMAFNRKAKNNIEKEFPEEETLFFKRKGTLHKVKISDILFIQANGDYTIAYTSDEKFYSTNRLSEISKSISDFNFFKVHRSYIVNLEQVNAVNIQGNSIHINDFEIPISRKNKALFLEKINKIK